MSDTIEPTTVKVQGNGLSIEVNLHELVNAIDPQGHYHGYNPDTDEDVFEPTSIGDQIASLAADHLVKAIRKDIAAKVEDQVGTVIQDEITALVREQLETGTLQATNEWGGKVGEPKPLKEVIIETAREALTKPVGDKYSGRGRQTVVQKIIGDAVGAAFAKELQAEVETAKAATLTAVRNSAAQVITETVKRATRGL